MADPFLAITLDSKRRIAQVARALDQPHPGPAAWGLLELLEDVWRRKDPAVSALVLAACFGPDPRWPTALAAFRFLAPAPGADNAGWVLHPEEADRLLLTHAKRVAAGKARAGGAKRSAHGRLQRSTSTSPAPVQHTTSTPPAADQLLHPAPSTQHPAPKKKPAGSAPADPPSTPVTKKVGPEEKPAAPVTAPSARPGWQALINRLTATFARLMPGAPKYDFRGHDAKALALVLDRGVAPDVVEAAWARALAHQGFPAVRTLPELEKNLNHFLGAAQALRKGPDPNQGIMSQQDGDDEKQREWIERLNRARDDAMIEGKSMRGGGR